MKTIVSIVTLLLFSLPLAAQNFTASLNQIKSDDEARSAKIRTKKWTKAENDVFAKKRRETLSGLTEDCFLASDNLSGEELAACGEIAVESNAFNLAQIILEKVVDPKLRESKLTQTARLFIFMAKPDEALAAANEVISLNRNNATAHNIAGLVWHEKKDYDKAVQNLGEAVRLSPTARFLRNLARALAAKNDVKNAFKHFDQSVALEPFDAGYLATRGAAYLQAVDTKKALEDAEEAIKISPKDPSGYGLRNAVLTQIGRAGEAKADFAAFQLGLECAKKRDFICAAQHFSRSIELNPSNLSGYGNRSEMYFQLGQMDDALKDLNAAEEINPNFVSIYPRRAIFNEKLGKLDAAARDYRKYAQLAIEERDFFSSAGGLYRVTDQLIKRDINKGVLESTKNNYIKNLELSAKIYGGFIKTYPDEKAAIQGRRDCYVYLTKLGKDKSAEAEADEKTYTALLGTPYQPGKLDLKPLKQSGLGRAVILDVGKIYDEIAEAKCFDMSWATPEQKAVSSKKGWEKPYPKNGDEGEIIYETKLCSQDIKIVILKVGKNYLPIENAAVKRLN